MIITLDNKIELVFDEGEAISKDVEVVINSANNGLLLGGSGAKAIKDATGPQLDSNEDVPDAELLRQFQEVYASLRPMGDSCGKWIGEVCKEWIKGDYKTDPETGERKSSVKETYVQLECLKAIEANEGRPLDSGSAVLTSSGKIFAQNPSKPRAIIHAVGMGYTWDKKETDDKGKVKYRKGGRILATVESVKSALEKSFDIIAREGFQSVSLPLMCVRDGYSESSTSEEKKAAIARACLIHDGITLQTILDYTGKTQLKKIVYCADNDKSRDFFIKRGRFS